SGDKGMNKDSAQALYWYQKLAAQNDPESLNDVAWAYATSTDPAIHNPSAAINLAQRVVDVEKDHPIPAHLDTLAEAFYANGNREAAIKAESQAIALLSDSKSGYYEKQLKKYQEALNSNDRQH